MGLTRLGLTRKDKMLREKVKDKITGFTGIAVAKCEYLNGCVCYEVRPDKLKDGCMLKTEWIDVQQLELVNPSRRKLPSDKGASGGGHNNIPPQLSTPSED